VGEGLTVTVEVLVFVTEGLSEEVGVIEGETPIVPRKL
jgi:hypothetical protein